MKEGYCKTDPARDLVGAIPQAKQQHFASIADPAKVGEMLRAFGGFSGAFPVQCADWPPFVSLQRLAPSGSQEELQKDV